MASKTRARIALSAATMALIAVSVLKFPTVANAQSNTAPVAMPESSRPLGFAVSPAINDISPEIIQQGLQTPAPDADGVETGIRNPKMPWVPSNSPDSQPLPSKADGAQQTLNPPKNIPATALTFDGVLQADNATAGFGALTPPDTNGSIGPNNYVQQVNLLVKIFGKTGSLLAGPFKLSSLWVAAGPPASTSVCAAPDEGDPVVLYDALSDRWLLSQFGFTSTTVAPFHQCVAISKTNDPTGQYYLYDFVTGGATGAAEFPDYPKMSVWPDGYYMMVHQFTNGGPFNGSGYYSFDRSKMLLGDPTAGYIYFNLNLTSHPEGIGGSLPSSLDGLTVPPAGRPATFAYLTSTVFGDPADGIRLFEFHSDFNTPANSTLTEPYTTYATPLAVAAYDPTTPTGNQNRRAVPQPGVTVTAALDAITDRFMHRMQYRNFGTYETLVSTHNVGAPGSTVFNTFRAAPRYYELRRSLPSGTWVVNEQATFAPTSDALSRWMGSAAEDNQGNLAIGYTTSGAAAGQFPSLVYAGRLATDPPGGLFQGEQTMFAGTGSQSSTGNRWGDYSALSVDPSDDCTFWYTNEYYSGTSATNWRTRIGNFKFAGCTATPRGTLTGVVTSCATGLPVVGANIVVSDGHGGVTGPGGIYSVTLSPGAYSAYAALLGSANSAPGPFTIANGGNATYNACVSSNPVLSVLSNTVSGGDGAPGLKPNDCKQMNVAIQDSGNTGLSGATATLTSSTPGVVISQPNSPYPDMSAFSSASNSAPFSITTTSALACGPINFSLKINSAQGVFMLPFVHQACASNPITFSGSIAAASPTQTGRLTRNGVVSSCSSPKSFPGQQDSTTRHRQTFGPFTNNGSSSACVTVNLTASGTCSSGLNLFGSTYIPSFNPANIQTNYAADPGSTFAGTASWSMLVPAGQNFFVNANEVTANGGCSGFTGSITGLSDSSGGIGACTVPVNSGPINLVTTSVLSKLGNGSYQAIVTVTNIGTGTAQNVQMTGGTLGSGTGSVLPILIGSIVGNGGSAVVQVSFPASSGASGATVIESLKGSYTGGTFSASLRAKLP